MESFQQPTDQPHLWSFEAAAPVAAGEGGTALRHQLDQEAQSLWRVLRPSGWTGEQRTKDEHQTGSVAPVRHGLHTTRLLL